MKAILYYVVMLNDKQDEKRKKKLDKFLIKHDIEVIQTYYDVKIFGNEYDKKGLLYLIDDLENKEISADAFICMSVTDIGSRKFLINTLSKINSYIPSIYFTDIENSNSDDIE